VAALLPDQGDHRLGNLGARRSGRALVHRQNLGSRAEFAANSKGDITLQQVLTHQGGYPNARLESDAWPITP